MGDLDDFRASFKGDLLTAADEGYDAARGLFNGAIDRRPALIARCRDADDVAAAIRYGRLRGLPLSVRGGGHNYAGHAVADDGLMIHLGAMNDVSVDPSARRAICGGGATWAELDLATQAHGLAVTGGMISHTGVAGLTLGGGIGWLTKRMGLTCDNLVGAEIVTADSRTLWVSAGEHPDLFWALRGGGGNFGVVTRFEFALQEVGPLVDLAFFFWELERGTEALAACRDFIEALPDSAAGFIGLAMSAPPAPFVPEEHHFRVGHSLMVTGFAGTEAHAALLAPLREKLPPLFEMVTPLPYVALQQLFDEGAPWGVYGYEKALYLESLSDEVIAIINQHAAEKGSPLSFCPTFPLVGAYGAVPDDATAFGGSRAARYLISIDGHALSAEDYEGERTWVRRFWEALRPFAPSGGSYVNFLSDDDADRVRATYGQAKYERLARIKAHYDPDNVFRHNANIPPSAAPA